MPISGNLSGLTDAQFRALQNSQAGQMARNDPTMMAEIARRRNITDQAGYKKQREAQLGEWDTEAGKFYDLMRQGFRQRTQGLASNALTQGTAAVNQSAARRGLSFSGLEQAAQANMQGQIGASQLEANSSYDQRLNELRQSSRDEFRSGQFDFFNSLQRMTHQANLDKELSAFQADLADQYSSGWQDLLGSVGSAIGMFAGGGFGNLFGGGQWGGMAPTMNTFNPRPYGR